MNADGHQGAHAPGPLVQAPDPRVGEINDAVRMLEAFSESLPGVALARDTMRAYQSANQRLDREPLQLGLVVHAMASLGWYRVQAGNAWIACCQASTGSLLPPGVRDVGGILPNSQVLVYRPAALPYGIIVGVLPPLLRDGRIVNPDWLVPGGQSGVRREAIHRYPIGQLHRNGGVMDFSGQRPLDSTAMERGQISSTGIAFLLDDYQAFLRVNEQCGLFLNYYDGYTRLAGVQLDVGSIVHEEAARDDEGESYHFRGVATYPWEALGLPAPGTAFTRTYDDKAVQDSIARAKVDLPDDMDDVQPAYRWQEYGGYLGQGHLRALMRPADSAGPRRYRDTAPDEGLFCESIGPDGDYSLRSAKSVYIGRRVKIVVPRAIRLPEDPAGDDARAGNYRASGRFGEAAEHRLAEVAVAGERRSMRRLAAVADLVAFGCNWKALHPFHYHRGDYSTPQESAQDAHFDRTQDELDFAALERSFALPDPTPRRLRIDHRYSSVEFYQRESFLYLLDDGGVALGCGFGAQIAMTGGRIRLESPSDVEICPGRDVIVLGDQIILRARQALDATVARGDLRLKAERNLQALAGNGGSGGLLLESKSDGSGQDYRDRVGADAVGNGVTIRAARSTAAILAGDVYLRTGGADMNPGDITLDAGKGAGLVQCYSSSTNVYCSTGQVSFFYGPDGETSDVSKTYAFGPQDCVMDVGILFSGPLVGFRNGTSAPSLLLDGPVICTGAVATSGSVASGSGGMLGKVPGGFAAQVTKGTGPLTQTVVDLNDGGGTLHDATFVQKYYRPGRLGNDDQVPAIGFTYRDPDGGAQYHVEDLAWPERRWEQLVRLGGGTGGHAWDEPAVRHGGKDLLPWPGRQKWREDEAFLQLAGTTMYDTAAGVGRDRPGPYEAPELADWKTTTMSKGYQLIRSDPSA